MFFIPLPTVDETKPLYFNYQPKLEELLSIQTCYKKQMLEFTRLKNVRIYMERVT